MRYPVNGKVLVFQSSEAEPFDAWLSDISCGGAFIQTHRLLPKGTELRLVFGAEGGYDLTGTIVRTADPITATPATLGFAVQFAQELPST